MFFKDYGKKPIVQNALKLSASVFMRTNIATVRKLYKEKFNQELKLNEEKFVQKLIGLIEDIVSVNVTQTRNGRESSTELTKLNLTCSKSNLGKGFIFWFICTNCRRRVRYLYTTPYSTDFYCRKCHGLVYEKQNKTRDKLVAKMIRSPELISTYMHSGSWKQQLAALKASILREEAAEEVYKEVEKDKENKL